MEESGPLVTVRGEGFAFGFDRERGSLVSVRTGGAELLASPPRLQLWRAPTDNDARSILPAREPGAVRWVDLGLDRVSMEGVDAHLRRRRDGVVVLDVDRRLRVGAPEAPVTHRTEFAVTLPSTAPE